MKQYLVICGEENWQTRYEVIVRSHWSEGHEVETWYGQTWSTAGEVMAHGRDLSSFPKRIRRIQRIIAYTQPKARDCEGIIFRGRIEEESVEIKVCLSEFYKRLLLKDETERKKARLLKDKSVGFWKKLRIRIFGVKLKIQEQVPFLNEVLDVRLESLRYSLSGERGQAQFAKFVEDLKQKGIRGEEYRQKIKQWRREHRDKQNVCAHTHSDSRFFELLPHRRQGRAEPTRTKIVGAERFRILPFAIGSFWLVLGVFTANSSRIAPKILRWNFIIAWAVIFGIPCAILFKLSFRRVGPVEKTPKEETSIPKAIKEEDNESEDTGVYKEAFMELSEDEANLQETQEVDMDFEDENNY